MTGPITPRAISSLPTDFPIFPLGGALLLPKGQLPLNIFEPRYLRMVDDALRGERMIGMVQPTEDDGAIPAIFNVGCAGRITTFSETDDGRYHIVLTGLCRFLVKREIATDMPYRMVEADFQPFAYDLHKDEVGDKVDRELFLEIMFDYMNASDLTADWEAAKSASIESLVMSLSMGCPFANSEKQALLEAPTTADRAECLMALMEMAGGEEPTVQ